MVHLMRPHSAKDPYVILLLYSTVSMFSPGHRMPSSISSFSVIPPPGLGLPAAESQQHFKTRSALTLSHDVLFSGDLGLLFTRARRDAIISTDAVHKGAIFE